MLAQGSAQHPKGLCTQPPCKRFPKQVFQHHLVRVRGWGPARRYVIPGRVGLGSCGRSRVLVLVLVLVLVAFRSVGWVAVGGSRPARRDPPGRATHPARPTGGDPPAATHPARPTRDPPRTLIRNCGALYISSKCFLSLSWRSETKMIFLTISAYSFRNPRL